MTLSYTGRETDNSTLYTRRRMECTHTWQEKMGSVSEGDILALGRWEKV